MKKYQVHCRLAENDCWHETIEADKFNWYESGFYYFYNSDTKKEWYFPIKYTIITIKPE